MLTSDQRAPARLGIDDLVTRQITDAAEKVYDAREARLVEQVTDALYERLTSNPLDAMRIENRILSAREVADYLQVTPKTVHYWTRFPKGDPRRLRRLTACGHIRILGSDLAAWIERNRS